MSLTSHRNSDPTRRCALCRRSFNYAPEMMPIPFIVGAHLKRCCINFPKVGRGGKILDADLQHDESRLPELLQQKSARSSWFLLSLLDRLVQKPGNPAPAAGYWFCG